jgi:hypothetical protein
MAQGHPRAHGNSAAIWGYTNLDDRLLTKAPLIRRHAGPDSATIDHVFGCSGAFGDASVHMEGQRPITRLDQLKPPERPPRLKAKSRSAS